MAVNDGKIYYSFNNTFTLLPTANNAVLTTNSSGIPALTTVGSGLSVSSNTLSATGPAINSTTVVGNNQHVSMAVFNTYIINQPSGSADLTLPVTANVGEWIDILVSGTSNQGTSVLQNASQKIYLSGYYKTTAGVSGSVSTEPFSDSTTFFGSFRLYCVVANTTWQIMGLNGFNLRFI